MKLIAVFLSCCIAAVFSFDFETATINDVRNAISSGQMKCVDIVLGYLERINAYDLNDPPALHAVIKPISDAMLDALQLDSYYANSSTFVGPMHCVPVLVKDNIDVAWVPNTGGINAFKNLYPAKDSPAVKALRDAGAVMIAKTNMAPLAMDGSVTNSETGGLARNPFGLDRTTYGSSGGTGAGLAARYAIVGLGTDTGGSVMLPSSAANLYGLRPTWNASISTVGVIPLLNDEDTVGLMSVTANDLMEAYKVIVGDDRPPSIPDTLSWVKLGVMQNLLYSSFPISGGNDTYEVEPGVFNLMVATLENMEKAGAAVKNITDKDLPPDQAFGYLGMVGDAETVVVNCMPDYYDAYFGYEASAGSLVPFNTFQQLVYSNTLPEEIQSEFADLLKNRSQCAQGEVDFATARQAYIANVMDVIFKQVDFFITVEIRQ